MSVGRCFYSRSHRDPILMPVAGQRFHIKPAFRDFRCGKLGVVDIFDVKQL